MSMMHQHKTEGDCEHLCKIQYD